MPPSTKMRDTDLSKLVHPKVKEKMKKAATRVNTQEVADFLSYKSDKANQGTKGKTKFTRRVREPNEALPPSADLFMRRNYKTGDGDTPIFQRPGSDHSAIKSRGLGT